MIKFKYIVMHILIVLCFNKLEIYSHTEYITVIPNINEQLIGYSVNYIHQDYFGFLWFGTNNGLLKYNGYDLIEYIHDQNDSSSICSNSIFSIYEDLSDSGRVMWIGSSRGLSKYDRVHDTFHNYFLKKDYSLGDNNNVLDIYKDNKDNFWLVSETLIKFDVNNNEINNFLSNITELSVYSVIQDHLGYIWVGSNLGLIKIDTRKQVSSNYEIFPVKQDNPYGMNHNMVYEVYEDGENVLWIGTYDGIYIFDPLNKKFNRPVLNVGDPNIAATPQIEEDEKGNIWACGREIVRINKLRDSLISFPQYRDLNDTATSIKQNNFYIDNSGIIWASLGEYGIRKLIPANKNFKHFSHEPNNKYSLPHNHVTSFMEDNEGVMWLGTEWDGLVKFDKKTDQFFIASGSPIVYNISKDPFGVLWFSCLGALASHDPKTGFGSVHFGNGFSNTYYAKVSDNPSSNRLLRNSLFNNVDPSLINMRDASKGIYYCYVDSKGTIWTSIGDKNLLYKYDKISGKFSPFNIAFNGKTYNSFSMIFEDSDKTLWFGTHGEGLIKLLNENDEYKPVQYAKDENQNNSLSNNYILDIAEDSLGFLWIGTINGINKFDKTNNLFYNYGKKDGLLSNKVIGIVVDDEGYIWLSSDKGLSKLDPSSGGVKNYNESFGLQSKVFSRMSRYKDSEGNIYFGGRKGFYLFNPSEIENNSNLPSIILTDFKLFNKHVPVGQNSSLKKSLEFSRELILGYNKKIFTIEFAAMEYTDPDHNLYRYKMVGVDPDWVNTDATRRFATYTMLDPGEYKFMVQGSNNDGIWNRMGAEISIIILPPWWQTSWAYLLYFLTIVGIIYFIWKIRISKMILQHQAEIDRLNAEKSLEMNRLKSRFFANISHEFRTPLTLILGLVNKVKDQLNNGKNKEELNMVSQYALKINKLVDQLLDLSKLESGKMKLELKLVNLVSLLKGKVNSFSSLADIKGIQLNITSTSENIPIKIDQYQFEKIIDNLLINAFKFTQSKGEINIELKEFNTEIELTITDTGIGISEERIGKIFDRFYQADNSQTRELEGTGIGLALTKELVELHGGTISVKSEEGKGSKFILLLPLNKTDRIIEFKGNNKIVHENNFLMAEDNQTRISLINEQNELEILIENEKPILLLVEDNYDVRQYIKGFFERTYQLMLAENGIEGFDKAVDIIPDIIISDVMMPKMDGFQLLEKLKTDERTNHIPVVLLTAKASDQDKIDGLEIGADDYMMKPFDAVELQLRVKNLVVQRQRIREHFKKQGIVNLKDEKINSADKIFLQKALKVIENYISDTKFGVEQFSDQLAMSRQQLRRKFISIIGETPSDFIRKVRLKRAKKLIEQNFGNISEIAYEVGFDNPAYFTQSFKKYFGITPSQFEQKNIN